MLQCQFFLIHICVFFRTRIKAKPQILTHSGDQEAMRELKIQNQMLQEKMDKMQQQFSTLLELMVKEKADHSQG